MEKEIRKFLTSISMLGLLASCAADWYARSKERQYEHGHRKYQNFY